MKKQVAPNYFEVQKHFQKRQSEILNIYCGKNSYLDSKNHSLHKSNFVPSTYLPHLHDFHQFEWPVKGLSVRLVWDYEDVDRQIQFANYLSYRCKAFQVFTTIHGIETQFLNCIQLVA